MISKERLEELIEKEATIWSCVDGFVNVFPLKKDIFCDDDSIEDWDYLMKIENLYETKAEAEFEADFGNIERVVKMPVPPTWEEFQKRKSYSFKKNEDIFLLHQDRYDGNDMFKIEKITCAEKENIKTWHFVEDFKDTYIKALRKMVELFKEEV